jgi:hypothetical protein
MVVVTAVPPIVAPPVGLVRVRITVSLVSTRASLTTVRVTVLLAVSPEIQLTVAGAKE